MRNSVEMNIITEYSNHSSRFIIPLKMKWFPKEDITTYELAKCMPYLTHQGPIMPYEIDKNDNHFRHFVIIDNNI